MRAKLTLICVIGMAMSGWASSASAHHAFAAEFDATKPFKLTGVVTKVEWQNPHTFFYLDIADDQTKKVTNWAFELGSPNGLMRNGWTRNTLKVGDVVTVEGSLARSGTSYGNAQTVMLNGKRLFAASSRAETP